MPSKNTSHPKPVKSRYLKHAVSFKNLSLGATDLDGLIEYHQLCYVLFELKYGDAIPPEGQRIALVRMCDDLQRVKPTLLILGTHDTPFDRPIDAASARRIPR